MRVPLFDRRCVLVVIVLTGGCPAPVVAPGADAAPSSDVGAARDDGGLDAAAPLDGPSAPDAPGPPPSYVTEERTLDSGGVSRPYLLARPEPYPTGTPLALVVSLHGDGGSGPGMRAALPLEAEARGAAVFVYPSAPGGSFEYWTDAGRAREASFVTDLVAALAGELGIDTARVFLAGFSGGATMANALGCRLGDGVVRGLGLHSGTLYPVDDAGGTPDFGYTAGGGVTCALPPAIFVWGVDDATAGVSFADGEGVRDNYLATHACAATSTPASSAPCVAYDGCDAPVLWCPIEGMGHSVWPGAAPAVWGFFDALR